MPINPSLMLKYQKQSAEATFNMRMREAERRVTPKYNVVVNGQKLNDQPVTMREISDAGMLKFGVQVIPA